MTAAMMINFSCPRCGALRELPQQTDLVLAQQLSHSIMENASLRQQIAELEQQANTGSTTTE
jgi:hypothetical protein